MSPTAVFANLGLPSLPRLTLRHPFLTLVLGSATSLPRPLRLDQAVSESGRTLLRREQALRREGMPCLS
ncbi:hypothetical protein CCHR01_02908 [Colletotrichum chrysophilum]|uniref:Uncharacterized protein n=1 Tax=Colletotrichum chrysophilum TaxID=1836956 RepID=A0AAD9ATZ9_9PEZI|nr:hypothetical protein CCHR01_02908 [Colletotrichum chrysophilum]